MYNHSFAEYTLGSWRAIQFAKVQVDFFDEILELKKNSKILDVPCGVG